MPEEIDVTNIIGEESVNESIDMTSFDEEVQDNNLCTITVGECEIEIERRFTYREEGNELDEDCFSHDEMIEFAKEHNYGFIQGVWQSCCNNIVYSEYSDEYMEQGDAVYGYISRRNYI